MVSCAGGLALGGRLPVVNTYAAFLARAVEQARTNASMDARVIYLGQYAGLGYFTDGKSHQALDDLLRFQGLPGLTLLEPCHGAQAAALLDWAVERAPGAVYLRLHRTGVALPLEHADHGPFDPRDPRAPLVWGQGFRECLVSMGPVATRLGIEALATPAFSGWGLVAVCAPDAREPEAWARFLAPLTRVVAIEETWAPGVLRPWLDDKLLSLGLHPARASLQPRGFGASFRTLEACREHFGFTVAGLKERLSTRDSGRGTSVVGARGA
jgi:transketolase